MLTNQPTNQPSIRSEHLILPTTTKDPYLFTSELYSKYQLQLLFQNAQVRDTHQYTHRHSPAVLAKMSTYAEHYASFTIYYQLATYSTYPSPKDLVIARLSYKPTG